MHEGPNVRLLPTQAIATGLTYIFGETKHEISPDRRERLSERGKELVDELMRRQNALVNTAVCDCPHLDDCSHYMLPEPKVEGECGDEDPDKCVAAENSTIHTCHKHHYSLYEVKMDCVRGDQDVRTVWCRKPLNVRQVEIINGAWVICDPHHGDITNCPMCVKSLGGLLYDPCAVHEMVLSECNDSNPALTVS